MTHSPDFIRNIKSVIEAAWGGVYSVNDDNVKDAVNRVLSMLDCGKIRVAEKFSNGWVVHQWIKQAILLSFRIQESRIMDVGYHNGGRIAWFDKIKLKFHDWQYEHFVESGVRAVHGSVVRYSAHISRGVVLMPCFINVGAYIGEGTMIDTWSTVGSCAQVGKNCHISGGVGIGGVLEPIQANPVIIEDNCFIGARSEIAEGVIVGEGSVISMGVYIGSSTKIYNRSTGEIVYGKVPPGSVVVPGTIPSDNCALYCAVIVKQVDEKTRAKTSINELLRSV